MAPALEAYFAEQKETQWVRPPPTANKKPRKLLAAKPKVVAGGKGAPKIIEGAPLVDFRGVTVRYNSHVVFDQLTWVVKEGEKWVVLGGNGTGTANGFKLPRSLVHPCGSRCPLRL